MTALVTCAGRDCADTRITIPLVGRWAIDTTVTGADALTGRVLVRAGDLEFSGTAIRQAERRGARLVRIVGGAGRLTEAAPVRHWQNVPLRLPLGAALAAGAEAVAASSSARALELFLPRWTTAGQTIGAAVAGLAARAGATWRTLADGSIWIGTDEWLTIAPELDELEVEPHDARVDYGSARVPDVRPGTTLDGRRVRHVEHTITESSVRTSIWYGSTPLEDAQTVARSGLAGPPAWGCGVDYLARYEATVEAQAASGLTVDVRPDAPHLPRMAGIPLRLGLPGTVAKFAAGARVLVGWANGDPSLPYASDFGEGSTATSLAFAGGGPAAVRVGDRVDRNAAFATWMNSVEVFINGLVPGTVIPLLPPGTIGSSAEGSSKVTIG